MSREPGITITVRLSLAEGERTSGRQVRKRRERAAITGEKVGPKSPLYRWRPRP